MQNKRAYLKNYLIISNKSKNTMQSFYINLDHAVERDSIIQNQIKESKLLFDIERFSAVYGKNVPGKLESLSAGQLGCLLSHIGVVEKSLTTDDHLMVLEDDEEFSSMLNHSITLTNELDPKDWDIFYIDLTIVEIEDFLFVGRNFNSLIKNNLKPTALKLPVSFKAYGTHAYIINKNSKYKILGLLKNNLNIGLAIDNIFCAAIKEGLINAYMALPLLAKPGEETMKSQITTGTHTLQESWIEFRNLLNIEQILNNPNEYISGGLIEKTIRSVVSDRLNYSPLEVFDPYLKKIKSLN